MTRIETRYGKDRVRVLRVHRAGERHEVSELSICAMIEGDFNRAYTQADNSSSISTDTIKNLVNIVAHDNLALGKEAFCAAIAARLLERYPQITCANVSAHETKWQRLEVLDKPYPHGFLLDGNGQPVVEIRADRQSITTSSGIDGFTFLKSTESGWKNFALDSYTTLAPTEDRICATSLDARWRWTRPPADYAIASNQILTAMLEVFTTTYSHSVQDSLYRMGEAALALIPEIGEISLSCPNKHYLLVNLKPFGLDNQNQVFLPTDEPHGQIECTLTRD